MWVGWGVHGGGALCVAAVLGHAAPTSPSPPAPSQQNHTLNTHTACDQHIPTHRHTHIQTTHIRRVSALSLMSQAVHRLDKEAAGAMLDVCAQVCVCGGV